MNLDEIIMLVSNPEKNEDQIKKAAVYLMAYVQKYPESFNLLCLNKDKRDEFIYSMYSNFKHVCKIYDKKRCPFLPYLRKTIYQGLLSWKRTCIKRDVMEETVFDEYAYNYGLYACEKEADYGEEYDEPNDIKIQYTSKELLVLALKYNYYLSGRNIQKLAALTGLPLTKITEYIMAINKSMIAKYRNHEQKTNMLAKSYVLKKRYHLELDRLTKFQIIQRNKVSTSYDIQKRKVVKIRKMMLDSMVLASNAAISRTIGLPYRQVARILKKFKHEATSLF